MYPVVTLSRTYNAKHTAGTLTLPSGKEIKTLELPWLDNTPNVSCIPPGGYLCLWLERSGSGRYKRVWHVQGVQDRSGILIHVGNLLRHTKGCILPGAYHGTLERQFAVLASGAGLNIMRGELAGQDFLLDIK